MSAVSIYVLSDRKPATAVTSSGSSDSYYTGSDSGDYSTPYYWYDDEGDLWYRNGYDNEFIGFGDDYYYDDWSYEDKWDYYDPDYDDDYYYDYDSGADYYWDDDGGDWMESNDAWY